MNQNRSLSIAIVAVVVLLGSFLLYRHFTGSSAPPPSALGANRPHVPVELVGIGTVLSYNPRVEMPFIMDVFSNTPAARAGLKKGQLISKIDDVSTANMKLAACVQHLRGEEGTVVRLELLSPDLQTTNEVELTREKMKL